MELWLSVGGLVVGALIALRPVRVRVGRRGDITVVLAIGARRLCCGRAVNGTWWTLRIGPPSLPWGWPDERPPDPSGGDSLDGGVREPRRPRGPGPATVACVDPSPGGLRAGRSE